MSLSDLAATATAVGVVLVFVELVLGRLQARTSLEDELAREYREIASQLPFAAFFDKPDRHHPVPELHDCLEQYVRYFDLSNQQVFLRMRRRVSSGAWKLWTDGMQDNVERDGFKEAWRYVRHHSPKSYNELASLHGRWDHDPAFWEPPLWLRPWKAIRGLPDQPEARKHED